MEDQHYRRTKPTSFDVPGLNAVPQLLDEAGKQVLKPSIQFAQWRNEPPKPPQLSTRLRRIPWISAGLTALIITAYLGLLLFMELLHAGGVIMVTGGFIGMAIVSARFWQTPESVRELMDFPSPQLQFPVQVVLHAESGKLGLDRGIITFIDDLLHFEGHKLSFDLPSIAFVNPSGRHFSSTKPQGPYNIFWEFAGCRGRVEITVYRLVPGIARNYRMAFREAIIRWPASDPVKHKTLTFPPGNPDPEKGRKY